MFTNLRITQAAYDGSPSGTFCFSCTIYKSFKIRKGTCAILYIVTQFYLRESGTQRKETILFLHNVAVGQG